MIVLHCFTSQKHLVIFYTLLKKKKPTLITISIVQNIYVHRRYGLCIFYASILPSVKSVSQESTLTYVTEETLNKGIPIRLVFLYQRFVILSVVWVSLRFNIQSQKTYRNLKEAFFHCLCRETINIKQYLLSRQCMPNTILKGINTTVTSK